MATAFREVGAAFLASRILHLDLRDIVVEQKYHFWKYFFILFLQRIFQRKNTFSCSLWRFSESDIVLLSLKKKLPSIKIVSLIEWSLTFALCALSNVSGLALTPPTASAMYTHVHTPCPRRLIVLMRAYQSGIDIGAWAISYGQWSKRVSSELSIYIFNNPLPLLSLSLSSFI